MIRHNLKPGGWLVNVRRAGWDEDIKKAYEQLNLLPGTKYKPIAQVATQVVAGTDCRKFTYDKSSLHIVLEPGR